MIHSHDSFNPDHKPRPSWLMSKARLRLVEWRRLPTSRKSDLYRLRRAIKGGVRGMRRFKRFNTSSLNALIWSWLAWYNRWRRRVGIVWNTVSNKGRWRHSRFIVGDGWRRPSLFWRRTRRPHIRRLRQRLSRPQQLLGQWARRVGGHRLVVVFCVCFVSWFVDVVWRQAYWYGLPRTRVGHFYRGSRAVDVLGLVGDPIGFG